MSDLQKCLLCLEPAAPGAEVNQVESARYLLGALAELNQHVPLAVDLLVFGNPSESLQAFVAIQGLVNEFNWVDLGSAAGLAENLAPYIATYVAEKGAHYAYVVMGATTWSKDLLPRAAALLDLQPITDIVAILDANTFVRPVYAGNGLQTLRTEQSTQMLSFRVSAFNPLLLNKISLVEASLLSPVFVALPSPVDAGLSRLLREDLSATERPELTTARVVVSGGRGLQSAANFQLLYSLADTLGGAVGASRAAVDGGMAGNDMQVGQTGKAVAPDLYIAVGISGAVQHLAGMRDSKIVVAINQDADAPIFQVADYGLVADLFEAVPELIAALDAN